MIVDIVLEDDRAMRRALAGHPLRILDGKRQAFQRARLAALGKPVFGLRGLLQGLVEIAIGKAIDLALDALGPRDHRLHQFERAKLSAAENSASASRAVR